MLHFIKLAEDFADAVLSGEKNFEVRENDRGYNKGDFVKFSVVPRDRGACALKHDLEKKIYKITYVLSGWGIKEGFVVFGIKECEDKE